MSLIYDYLKIHGKSEPEGDSAVGIPPILKESGPKRHKSRTLLIIVGSCLVISLFIFSAVKKFLLEDDMQVVADSGSIATRPAGPDSAPLITEANALQQQQQFVSAPATKGSFPAVDSQAPEQTNTFSKNAIQVFPETEKPFAAEAGVMQKSADAGRGQSGGVPKKYSQNLELENRSPKILFPEDPPLYTEFTKPGENAIQDFPFHDDVAVQEYYEPADSQDNGVAVSSRALRQSSSAENRLHASVKPDSAALNKSKKLYQAGLQAQLSGDQRIAEIFYIKVLEEQPLHLEAMINLSALYVQQQRYGEAEEILADILKIYPANSKALVNRGVISLYENNDLLAEEQFQAALVANPMEENALVNLAYLAEKRMDYVSAEHYYKNLLQISPQNLEVLLAYGHLLEEEMRYPEAVAMYGECLKLDAVQKDQILFDKITQRVRLLGGGRKMGKSEE